MGVIEMRWNLVSDESTSVTGQDCAVDGGCPER